MVEEKWFILGDPNFKSNCVPNVTNFNLILISKKYTYQMGNHIIDHLIYIYIYYLQYGNDISEVFK